MKKKRSTRSKARGLFFNSIFVLFCLAGATVSFLLFVKSFTQSLYKQNEQPIATITFKYKTAQRKFIDRMIWDRLNQESPVYNGDTIRTAPLSEATIWFSDGNIMDLYENTLAQVFVTDTVIQAELAEGDITVNTAESSAGMVLSSGNASVQIDSGSTLSATRKDYKKVEDTTSSISNIYATGSEGIVSPTESSSFKVQVIQGTASLYNEFSPDLSERKLASGQSIHIENNGADAIPPSVTAIFPAPNERILNYENTPKSILFKWESENLDLKDYVMIETSLDKDFKNIVEQISISKLSQITLDMSDGTWYWRIYPLKAVNTDEENKFDESDIINNGASGKLQILSAPPPDLIVPVDDYVLSYRKRLPAVRLIWNGNELASSYQLSIADNIDMRNPIINQRTSSTSSIISTLEAGTWYWQVTPYYVVNNTGFASPSAVKSFKINQRGELFAPNLMIPMNNSLVNIQSETGVSFSWRNDIEAVSYTFIISSNTDLSSPSIKHTLSDNYYILTEQEQASLAGSWYWGVFQTDLEGNTSPVSEIRKFFGVEGELVQRTVFPPDGYKIADGRMPDVRFTWKTNLPYNMRYQVSSTPEFTTTVIDEIVGTSSIQGKTLQQGIWYWRIVADTDVMELKTPPRKFVVTPPLGAPVSLVPENETRLVVRPNKLVEVKWDNVEGAEYYRVRIYYMNNNQEKLIYEQNFIDKTSVFVDFDNQEEGLYRWTVQGFSDESEFATRRVGSLAESSFSMKKLKPVSLLSPKDGIEIDGIEAIINPPSISWSSVDNVGESAFILSTSQNLSEKENIIYKKNPGFSYQLPHLYSGKYYWIVKAQTEDGLDITAEEPSSFVVLPVPLLNRPESISPSNSQVFGAEYLVTSRNVRFSWQPVENATSYFFQIQNENGTSIISTELSDTYYELVDLAVLETGNFTWSVMAKRYLSTGVLLQNGEILKSSFSIDLPILKKPVFNSPGTLYGK